MQKPWIKSVTVFSFGVDGDEIDGSFLNFFIFTAEEPPVDRLVALRAGFEAVPELVLRPAPGDSAAAAVPPFEFPSNISPGVASLFFSSKYLA